MLVFDVTDQSAQRRGPLTPVTSLSSVAGTFRRRINGLWRATRLSIAHDAPRSYGKDYREHVTLCTGERLCLRPPDARDRQLLIDGFKKLSPESRRRRFLMAKNGLTENELRRLTDIDGVNHYAIGALALDGAGIEAVPVAMARFVRDDDCTNVAEFAVTVVDEWHNRGIGKMLLARLFESAKERGITMMRGHVLVDNEPMLHLLRKYLAGGSCRQEGPVLAVEFPIW